jgi:hypothetical protein
MTAMGTPIAAGMCRRSAPSRYAARADVLKGQAVTAIVESVGRSARRDASPRERYVWLATLIVRPDGSRTKNRRIVR